MGIPKSLRVLEFLHYGGELPVIHDEYKIARRGVNRSGAGTLSKTGEFCTDRRRIFVKLDVMESWLSRERMLTDNFMWSDSNGNEMLKSTQSLVEEYLEVYPEALSSIQHLEKAGDLADTYERKEFYRRNNVNKEWLNEDWLQSQKPSSRR